MYDTWCLSVSPDILNIPDIPEIPYIPDIPDIPAIPTVPDIPDIPFYNHAKSGCPSSKIDQVMAIFIKCANLLGSSSRSSSRSSRKSSVLLF